MDLAIGHKLAKGRPEREYLQTGDAVDSWKVIVVEPEKQLTLLFGMKAPGLGRLCFTLEDKGDYRTIDVQCKIPNSHVGWAGTLCRGCFTGY